MGGSQAKGLDDDKIVDLGQSKGLRVYAGFKAEERRIVFLQGTTHVAKKKLETWLPNGVREGDPRTIQNGEERGLVTFWFYQNMDEDAYTTEGRKSQWFPVDDDSNAWVKKLDNGRHALAQVWTINVNDEFRKTFTMEESIDKYEAGKFEPEAADTFRRAMVKVFGDSATDAPLHYCSKSTKNIQRVYFGTQQQFKEFFNEPGVKDTFGILKVEETKRERRQAGDAETLMNITVATINQKGTKGTMKFTFEPNGCHVLYKRNGYTSFMCLKSQGLFEKECKLFGELNVDEG